MSITGDGFGSVRSRKAGWWGAAALVAMLTGCTPTAEPAPTPAASEPTATATATAPSPSPSPSPSDAVLSGVSIGCDDLLASGDLAEVTGAAEAQEPVELWHVGFEAAGGVDCAFSSSTVTGRILALPAERAAALSDGAPECEQVYDTVECTATTVVDGLWVAVLLDLVEDPGGVPDVLGELLSAAAASVSEADRVAPVATDWSAETCDALGQVVRPTRLLDSDEVSTSRIEEGPGAFDRRVAVDLDLVRQCDWSELEDFREIGVLIAPAGADAWDREADRVGGSSVQIGDAAARELRTDAFTTLLIQSEGELIQVSGRGIPAEAVREAGSAVLTR